MFDLLKYFDLKEGYKLPQALLECLLDNTRKEKLFNDFLLENKDLSKAFFTDEFQTEHGDRDNFKQDFTPLNICKLTALLGGKAEKIADLCAGIGGLTVACWNFNPYSFYFCVEKTERAIPFLLFNLAIRNINGIVVLGDVLTLDTSNQERIFKLTPSYNFSEIEEINSYTLDEFDLIISNPPYSLKWQPFENQAFKYGIAPSKACDYSFIQVGLSLLNKNGKMVFILPHGVLFRGQAEGKIRKGIIEDNLISAVTGIADNCFLNTSIPVCLIEFDKNKTDNNILFVDASKECQKVGKINILTDEHVNKIFDAVKSRKDIERFSSLASFETIQQNDYNLNIPCYVDTYVPKQLPSLTETLNELFEIDNQIKETSEQLANAILSLKGFNKEEKEAVEKMGKNLEKWCTLERAQNNKIYPKGTIYTALSASDGIAYQLREDGYISDRYAVFIPKTKYINVFYEIFCESFEPFYQKYNQGINFAFNNFKFFDFQEITLSDNELQEMEEALKEINNLIDNEKLFIQQMKGFKNFCLSKMFC